MVQPFKLFKHMLLSVKFASSRRIPMAAIAHRFVTTNSIRMHYAEAGSGPIVLLCHGCPGSWDSWGPQLPALPHAGFYALAPDMRGDRPNQRPPQGAAQETFHMNR